MIRVPTWAGPWQAASTTSSCSLSKRVSVIASPPSSLDASVATAANTSSGATPRATSSATRRSAACSSANAVAAVCACALAIATATSFANIPSRSSAFAGSGAPDARTVIAPHTRPSVMIGAPTPLVNPRSRAIPAFQPGTPL